MGWFDSDCDNHDWKCTYGSWSGPWETWVVCYNGDSCPGWNDGGALVSQESGSGGGGGWP